MDRNIEITAETSTTCPAHAYQTASVCLPVAVTPYARIGVVTTKCCGEPVITEGRTTCAGTRNGSCYFTITQKICVTIPVEFGAVATKGDPYVTCIDADEDNICTNCR